MNMQTTDAKTRATVSRAKSGCMKQSKRLKRHSVLANATERNVIFECEGNCGFKGSFHDVEIHEKTCLKKKKLHGQPGEVPRSDVDNSAAPQESSSVEELHKEIRRLKAENDGLRAAANIRTAEVARMAKATNPTRASKRHAKNHARRMQKYRQYFFATEHALQLLAERLASISDSGR